MTEAKTQPAIEAAKEQEFEKYPALARHILRLANSRIEGQSLLMWGDFLRELNSALSTERDGALEEAAKDILKCFAHEDRDFPDFYEISHSITGAALTFGHLHKLSAALKSPPPAVAEDVSQARLAHLERNATLEEAASHLRDCGYWTQAALVLDLRTDKEPV